MVQLFSQKLLLRCSTFCHLCPEWLWGCWQWCPLPPITLLSKPPPFPTTHYLTATILSHKIPTCHILFPKGININNVFWPRRTLSFSNLIWGFGNLNFDFNLFRAYTHTSPGSPHMDRELCWACHSEGLSLLHQKRKVVCYPGSSSISYELSEHSSPQNWKYVQILGIQISYIPPTCWY